ncbi:osmoprotectant ABC transporter substrate-binding protein [Paenibacillus sp. ACRRX]|uniref:glycine betaine ABC transporter substrate-binding protein n=1 Tax=Paenibacillus sp. ACRRX TaxID=2918206 RepID=UPI001EF74F2F|nr:glycine betaine ABC transporter substrate-binding protein [Paenibacillus sp. ACRRX]MCG7409968.1 osmoprotectant ABC transporter substrate-binding protein [Paenibacillus sp. ACRRX]
MLRNKITAGLTGVMLMISVLLAGCGTEHQFIIGTQTFTETKILAEMYKALIEDRTDIKVKVIPDLASSTVVLNAIKNDDVQLGTLYSGEIFNNHFPIEETKDRDRVLRQAKEGFHKYWGLKWFDSLGFENTYAFTVRKDLADEKGYKQISDISKDAADLRLGVDTTWLERTDVGYPAFRKAYQYKFGKSYPMEQSLVYQAVGNNQVDIVVAYSTDSRLKAYNLITLEDDKQFFPPYDASPVMREDALQQHPEAAKAIEVLIGSIDVNTMINLNYQVDMEKKSEREVALQYLQDKGLLSKK